MKAIFDQLSAECSKRTTNLYSTSFSFGIKFLDKTIHRPIYAIYGMVRFADEIVDTFHDFDKRNLLADFRRQTFESIENGISLNPILNEFQWAVNKYNIGHGLIEKFFDSMEMDLDNTSHDLGSYQNYILGSAEVVGLMCLHVFVNGNDKQFHHLKPFAMSLGAAFQKVNFLRDIKADYEALGRTYFPGVEMSEFSINEKQQIEHDIEKDFQHALIGIKQLPDSSRKGVYLAYVYYRQLFEKIKRTPAEKIMNKRIRIPNLNKVGLMFQSAVQHQLNLL